MPFSFMQALSLAHTLSIADSYAGGQFLSLSIFLCVAVISRKGVISVPLLLYFEQRATFCFALNLNSKLLDIPSVFNSFLIVLSFDVLLMLMVMGSIN